VGPRGCGKSFLLQQLAERLGCVLEPVLMHRDMTSRDLLQQRTTTSSGDTVWRHSALVRQPKKKKKKRKKKEEEEEEEQAIKKCRCWKLHPSQA
jgi:ABC-type cobalamin/Fe3+-siderophores transport system ATPase subunit